MEDRDLLFFFLRSELGGRSDRVRFASGRHALTSLGLLREETRHDHRVEPLLLMHSLTYNILRDLRAPVPYEIERRYLDFLMSHEAEKSLTGNIDSGIANAWLRGQILSIAAGLDLPAGWKTIEAVDESTWVAVRQEPESVSDEGDSVGSDYIVRYEVHSGAIYVLDYRTGKRLLLDRSGSDSQELRRIVVQYHEAVMAFLQEVQ
jgi:hypothetical protein